MARSERLLCLIQLPPRASLAGRRSTQPSAATISGMWNYRWLELTSSLQDPRFVSWLVLVLDEGSALRSIARQSSVRGELLDRLEDMIRIDAASECTRCGSN